MYCCYCKKYPTCPDNYSWKQPVCNDFEDAIQGD